MNNTASTYMSTGILVASVTIAFFLGHVSSATHIVVVGSLVGSIILSKMLQEFK